MTRALRNNVLVVRQFEAVVVDGPDRGTRGVSGGDELTIGTSQGNTLQLTDAAVSRHHCALRVCARGLELRDLGSTNGTLLGESEVQLVYLSGNVRLRAGTSTIEIRLLDAEVEQPLAQSAACGNLIGGSPWSRMRRGSCTSAPLTRERRGRTVRRAPRGSRARPDRA